MGLGGNSSASRERSIVVLAMSLVVAVTTCGLFAQAAAANYYGIDNLYGASFGGATGSLRTNNMGVNPGTDFIDNEAWVDNTNSGLNWVETGLTKGHGSGCSPSTMSFFWADQRPGGGYHCHTGGAANYSTEYNFSIVYGGSCDWYTQVGSLSGHSTGSICSANLIQTGVEETTQSAYTCSSARNLGWYDDSFNFHSGWSDRSNGNGFLNANNPPGVYWVNRPNWLRAYSNESC